MSVTTETDARRGHCGDIISLHRPRDKTGQSVVLSTCDTCVPAQEDGRRSPVLSPLAARASGVVTPFGNLRFSIGNGWAGGTESACPAFSLTIDARSSGYVWLRGLLSDAASVMRRPRISPSTQCSSGFLGNELLGAVITNPVLHHSREISLSYSECEPIQNQMRSSVSRTPSAR